MTQHPVITIDGPAASGKSSVSRALARSLGWSWVSTGAFYRGLAYVAFQKNLDLEDTEALVKLALSKEWSVQMTMEKTKVIFQSEDVTEQIAHDDVGSFASRISSNPKVREALLQGQRACALLGPLIAEGRDCGTVVFPQAKIKIYLTASSENRAARRAQEHGVSENKILESQKQRDQQDQSRVAAPLQVPDKAKIFDTTGLALSETVSMVESYVKGSLQIL